MRYLVSEKVVLILLFYFFKCLALFVSMYPITLKINITIYQYFIKAHIAEVKVLIFVHLSLFLYMFSSHDVTTRNDIMSYLKSINH